VQLAEQTRIKKRPAGIGAGAFLINEGAWTGQTWEGDGSGASGKVQIENLAKVISVDRQGDRQREQTRTPEKGP